ncbi:MAG: hypothetical protein P9M07_05260 [Candidatus Aceula meridiana]|nr:hypothetical protein [Candidatus Aceula meridiana]
MNLIINRYRFRSVFKAIAILILVAFTENVCLPQYLPKAIASNVLGLPIPGATVPLSPSFTPAILRGIQVYPKEPLKFNFILDKGQSRLETAELKGESEKLVRYFLASLTLPEDDLWVNLSPYEKGRIVPESLGVTEMGRDMLAQDYLLKQVTASLIYPEDEMGKKFWERVYERAYEEYGTTDIPVDTFSKVWIVPEKAVVYENGDRAFVAESKLKVMLEEDYLAHSEQRIADSAQRIEEINNLNAKRSTLSANNAKSSTLTSDIVREIIIPELEHEVNFGRNFSQLRQIYHSMILATWFKTKLKNAFLTKAYADKSKVKGVDLAKEGATEEIYSQYIESFKKGVCDYIKVEYDKYTQKNVPRKYFSGGINWNITQVLSFTSTISAPLPQWVTSSSFQDIDLVFVSAGDKSAASFFVSSAVQAKKQAKKIITSIKEDSSEQEVRTAFEKLRELGYYQNPAQAIYNFTVNQSETMDAHILKDIVAVAEKFVEEFIAEYQAWERTAKSGEKFVVNFATGDTPWVSYRLLADILNTWDKAKTQEFLNKPNIDFGHKPDMNRVEAFALDGLAPQKRTDYHSFPNILNNMLDLLQVPETQRYFFYGDLVADGKKLRKMTSKEYESLLKDIDTHGSKIEEFLSGKLSETDAQYRFWNAMKKQTKQMSGKLKLRNGPNMVIWGVGPSYEGKGHMAFLEEGIRLIQDAFLGVPGHYVLAGHAKENGGYRNMVKRGYGFMTYGFKELLNRKKNPKHIVFATTASKRNSMHYGIEEGRVFKGSGKERKVVYPLQAVRDQRGSYLVAGGSEENLRLRRHFWHFDLIDEWTPKMIRKFFVYLVDDVKKNNPEKTLLNFKQKDVFEFLESDAAKLFGAPPIVRKIVEYNLKSLKKYGAWEELKKEIAQAIRDNTITPNGIIEKLGWEPGDRDKKVDIINPHLDDDYFAKRENIRVLAKQGYDIEIHYTAKGTTAVDDLYVAQVLRRIKRWDKAKLDAVSKRTTSQVAQELIPTLESQNLHTSPSDFDPWTHMTEKEKDLRAQALFLEIFHPHSIQENRQHLLHLIDALLESFNEKARWGARDVESIGHIKAAIRIFENKTAMMSLGIPYEKIHDPMDSTFYSEEGWGGAAGEEDIERVKNILRKRKPDLIISNGEGFADYRAHSNTEAIVISATYDLIDEGVFNPKKLKYMTYAGVWDRTRIDSPDVFSVVHSEQQLNEGERKSRQHFSTQSPTPIIDSGFAFPKFFSETVLLNAGISRKELLKFLPGLVDQFSILKNNLSGVLNYRLVDLNDRQTEKELKAKVEELGYVRPYLNRASNVAMNGPAPMPEFRLFEYDDILDDNENVRVIGDMVKALGQKGYKTRQEKGKVLFVGAKRGANQFFRLAREFPSAEIYVLEWNPSYFESLKTSFGAMSEDIKRRFHLIGNKPHNLKSIFKDASVSTVMFGSEIDAYFLAEQNPKAIFKEMGRVLKPNGYLAGDALSYAEKSFVILKGLGFENFSISLEKVIVAQKASSSSKKKEAKKDLEKPIVDGYFFLPGSPDIAVETTVKPGTSIFESRKKKEAFRQLDLKDVNYYILDLAGVIIDVEKFDQAPFAFVYAMIKNGVKDPEGFTPKEADLQEGHQFQKPPGQSTGPIFKQLITSKFADKFSFASDTDIDVFVDKLYKFYQQSRNDAVNKVLTRPKDQVERILFKPGVAEFLKDKIAQGATLVVLSGAKKEDKQPILEKLGLMESFKDIHFARTSKNKVEVFKKLIDEIDPNENVIIVDDSAKNVKEFRNILTQREEQKEKIYVVGLIEGNEGKAEKMDPHADGIVDDLGDLVVSSAISDPAQEASSSLRKKIVEGYNNIFTKIGLRRFDERDNPRKSPSDSSIQASSIKVYNPESLIDKLVEKGEIVLQSNDGEEFKFQLKEDTTPGSYRFAVIREDKEVGHYYLRADQVGLNRKEVRVAIRVEEKNYRGLGRALVSFALALCKRNSRDFLEANNVLDFSFFYEMGFEGRISNINKHLYFNLKTSEIPLIQIVEKKSYRYLKNAILYEGIISKRRNRAKIIREAQKIAQDYPGTKVAILEEGSKELVRVESQFPGKVLFEKSASVYDSNKEEIMQKARNRAAKIKIENPRAMIVDQRVNYPEGGKAVNLKVMVVEEDREAVWSVASSVASAPEQRTDNPELFTYESLVQKTDFLKEITRLNNNKEPAVINAVGSLEDVFKKVRQKLEEAKKNNNLTFLFAEIIRDHKTSHIVILDEIENLEEGLSHFIVDSSSSKSLNDNILYLRIDYDRKRKEFMRDEISVGRGDNSRFSESNIQRKGFGSEIYEKTVESLSLKYPGLKIRSYVVDSWAEDRFIEYFNPSHVNIEALEGTIPTLEQLKLIKQKKKEEGQFADPAQGADSALVTTADKMKEIGRWLGLKRSEKGKKYPVICVNGPPGAGKTIAIRAIIETLLKEEGITDFDWKDGEGDSEKQAARKELVNYGIKYYDEFDERDGVEYFEALENLINRIDVVILETVRQPVSYDWKDPDRLLLVRVVPVNEEKRKRKIKERELSLVEVERLSDISSSRYSDLDRVPSNIKNIITIVNSYSENPEDLARGFEEGLTVSSSSTLTSGDKISSFAPDLAQKPGSFSAVVNNMEIPKKKEDLAAIGRNEKQSSATPIEPKSIAQAHSFVESLPDLKDQEVIVVGPGEDYLHNKLYVNMGFIAEEEFANMIFWEEMFLEAGAKVSLYEPDKRINGLWQEWANKVKNNNLTVVPDGKASFDQAEIIKKPAQVLVMMSILSDPSILKKTRVKIFQNAMNALELEDEGVIVLGYYNDYGDSRGKVFFENEIKRTKEIIELAGYKIQGQPLAKGSEPSHPQMKSHTWEAYRVDKKQKLLTGEDSLEQEISKILSPLDEEFIRDLIERKQNTILEDPDYFKEHNIFSEVFDELCKKTGMLNFLISKSLDRHQETIRLWREGGILFPRAPQEIKKIADWAAPFNEDLARSLGLLMFGIVKEKSADELFEDVRKEDGFTIGDMIRQIRLQRFQSQEDFWKAVSAGQEDLKNIKVTNGKKRISNIEKCDTLQGKSIAGALADCIGITAKEEFITYIPRKSLTQDWENTEQVKNSRSQAQLVEEIKEFLKEGGFAQYVIDFVEKEKGVTFWFARGFAAYLTERLENEYDRKITTRMIGEVLDLSHSSISVGVNSTIVPTGVRGKTTADSLISKYITFVEKDGDFKNGEKAKEYFLEICSNNHVKEVFKVFVPDIIVSSTKAKTLKEMCEFLRNSRPQLYNSLFQHLWENSTQKVITLKGNDSTLYRALARLAQSGSGSSSTIDDGQDAQAKVYNPDDAHASSGAGNEVTDSAKEEEKIIEPIYSEDGKKISSSAHTPAQSLLLSNERRKRDFISNNPHFQELIAEYKKDFDRLVERHSIDMFNDIYDWSEVDWVGGESKYFFRHLLKRMIEEFPSAQLDLLLPELIEAWKHLKNSRTDSRADSFNAFLDAKALYEDPDDAGKIARDYVRLSDTAGRGAQPLFRRNLPTLLKGIDSETLKTIWPEIVKLGEEAGVKKITAIMTALAGITDKLHTPEDVRQYGAVLLELANNSMEPSDHFNESPTLLGGVALVSPFVNSPEELRVRGQALIESEKRFGDNASWLFSVAETYKTLYDDFDGFNRLIDEFLQYKETAGFNAFKTLNAMGPLVNTNEDLKSVMRELQNIFGQHDEWTISATLESIKNLITTIPELKKAGEELIKVHQKGDWQILGTGFEVVNILIDSLDGIVPMADELIGLQISEDERSDVFRGLGNLRKILGDEAFRQSWASTKDLVNKAGEYAPHILNYGIGNLKHLVQDEESLKSVGDQLLLLAQRLGSGKTFNAFSGGLKAAVSLINSSEDVLSVGSELARMRESATDSEEILFRSLSVLSRRLGEDRFRQFWPAIVETSVDAGDEAWKIIEHGASDIVAILDSEDDYRTMSKILLDAFLRLRYRDRKNYDLLSDGVMVLQHLITDLSSLEVIVNAFVSLEHRFDGQQDHFYRALGDVMRRNKERITDLRNLNVFMDEVYESVRDYSRGSYSQGEQSGYDSDGFTKDNEMYQNSLAVLGLDEIPGNLKGLKRTRNAKVKEMYKEERSPDQIQTRLGLDEMKTGENSEYKEAHDQLSAIHIAFEYLRRFVKDEPDLPQNSSSGENTNDIRPSPFGGEKSDFVQGESISSPAQGAEGSATDSEGTNFSLMNENEPLGIKGNIEYVNAALQKYRDAINLVKNVLGKPERGKTEKEKIEVQAYFDLMKALSDYFGENTTYIYPVSGADSIPAIFRKTFPINKDQNDFDRGEELISRNLGVPLAERVNLVDRTAKNFIDDAESYIAELKIISGKKVLLFKGLLNFVVWPGDNQYEKSLQIVQKIIEEVLINEGDSVVMLRQVDLLHGPQEKELGFFDILNVNLGPSGPPTRTGDDAKAFLLPDVCKIWVKGKTSPTVSAEVRKSGGIAATSVQKATFEAKKYLESLGMNFDLVGKQPTVDYFSPVSGVEVSADKMFEERMVAKILELARILDKTIAIHVLAAERVARMTEFRHTGHAMIIKPGFLELIKKKHNEESKKRVPLFEGSISTEKEVAELFFKKFIKAVSETFHYGYRIEDNEPSVPVTIFVDYDSGLKEQQLMTRDDYLFPYTTFALDFEDSNQFQRRILNLIQWHSAEISVKDKDGVLKGRPYVVIDRLITERYLDALIEIANKPLRDLSAAELSSAPGGIDFNPQALDLQIQGEGVEFELPVELQGIDFNNIEGFVPVIINITPVTNIWTLMGLNKEDFDDSEWAQEIEADEPKELSYLN